MPMIEVSARSSNKMIVSFREQRKSQVRSLQLFVFYVAVELMTDLVNIASVAGRGQPIEQLDFNAVRRWSGGRGAIGKACVPWFV